MEYNNFPIYVPFEFFRAVSFPGNHLNLFTNSLSGEDEEETSNRIPTAYE